MTNPIPMNIKNRLSHLLESAASINEVNGGLFNYVYKINTNNGDIVYLKIFTDKAKSNNFPPLPTSPTQRCFIAMSSHKVAHESSLGNIKVNVPLLLDYNLDDCFVLMEESFGTSLFDSLINRDFSLKPILHSYETCMKWLADMHITVSKNREDIGAASELFKAYKIELQYSKLIPLLPSDIQDSAKIFIKEYLNSKKQLVHGDLNSKNILVDSKTHIVSIIDFEQGHLGCGLYDVSYLCSELVIRLLISNEKNMENYIDSLLKTYCAKLSDADITNYRIHLAFQVLYRLVGPSKGTWSGHLSETEAICAKLWSIKQLAALLNFKN